jgi:hypothetical protein
MMKDDFTNGCDVPDDQKERHYDVFEEVVLISRYLRKHQVLTKISEEVRGCRGDASDATRPSIFSPCLQGYAISGERTLETFYERIQPFAVPFMAGAGP